MDTSNYRMEAMRRGSYDDAAASLRPHFKNLAQRRRSAPSLVFGKSLGMAWSPIREESVCCVSVEQSPFVHGLAVENGELLLDQRVQVIEGTKSRERHLFLFSDAIVLAKYKSPASFRLKDTVSLKDIWLYGFEEEDEEDEQTPGDIDLTVTIILAWALKLCLVTFCSPEVKEHWVDTLHRKIKETKARAGCDFSPPDVLMKVLSGSVATKSLTGGGMDGLIEIPLDGDAKLAAQLKDLNSEEEKLTHLTGENKFNQVVKRLKKGSSFMHKHKNRAESYSKTQLFGQPLIKICPDLCSLPKPITEILVLLRKHGPSTEGVFRKSGNSKNMKDIREQLNSGVEVDLENQHVFLLVGLLKSFLKELPGSLLVSDLFDHWISALDHEDVEQRNSEIRKVADKLPGHNKLLLQHLLCLLHHILENSHINKMDAHNLAICIAPTLLQLGGAVLYEQKDKVLKLTEVLIENYEILGENIPALLDTDEDSVSSNHHDSAYDSTDPDGDGEAADSVTYVCERCSSLSSLSPGTTTSNASLASDVVLKSKPPYNRRCSEPSILTKPSLQGLSVHARSHEDCSLERTDFQELPLKKQISDDSFLLRRRGGDRHVQFFPRLSSNIDLSYMTGNRAKDCSCSSLESTASNQSEGSVFTSSPAVSPSCQKRGNTTSTSTKPHQEIPAPITDEKRRSSSMKSKVLMRTRSLGAFSRSSLKRDSQKENSFPCETLQEDSQSEAESPAEPLHRHHPLSAIEVFRQVDSRQPCSPPSYEQAMQNEGMVLPPQYGAMTVQHAIELGRRSRPSSVNYDSPPITSDHFSQDGGTLVNWRLPYRQRAMSESVSRRDHDLASRRCSQPVFDELSYAKESYV